MGHEKARIHNPHINALLFHLSCHIGKGNGLGWLHARQYRIEALIHDHRPSLHCSSALGSKCSMYTSCMKHHSTSKLMTMMRKSSAVTAYGDVPHKNMGEGRDDRDKESQRSWMQDEDPDWADINPVDSSVS